MPEGHECLRHLPGILPEKGLAGGLLIEHDAKIIGNDIPITAASRPMPGDFLRGQVQHFLQAVVMGEGWLVFRDLTELPVEPLDDIRRIYYLPNLGRISEEGCEPGAICFL